MASRLVRLREFLRLEAAGGILLLIAALVALAWANSPLGHVYTELLDIPVIAQVGTLKIAKPLVLWINDGLMAIFFLVVGLEIKREILEGELSTVRQAALPAIAAAGGMAAPALVYAALNWGNPTTLAGWAIPSATDIAFSIGVLALLGDRVPAALKSFLLALAIIDDLGAIVIIACFYTADLSLASLGLATAGILVLVGLNRARVGRLAPYVVVGILVWVFVLKSGVHATLAGVALALAVPSRRTGGGSSLAQRLEEGLHPWVTYGILPLFAFANAGVSMQGLAPATLVGPVPLGIGLGLFLGKQAGVMISTAAAVWLGAARLPGSGWPQFYGVALLTGIGFTMSLFIGTLAFSEVGYTAEVRVGVLAGSLLSAVAGYLVLRLLPARQAKAGGGTKE